MAAYATVEQLKSQPGVTGTADDLTMQLMLDAAAEAIDGYCNRKQDGFLATVSATQRYYKGDGLSYLFVDECVEVTTVEIRYSNDSSWMEIPSGEYLGFQGSPDNPNYNRFPYHAIGLVSFNTAATFPDGNISQPWGFVSDVIGRENDMLRYPTVRVTARWGYSDTVPNLVVQANITQAARWFKRGQSFWADSAASGDGRLEYRRVIDPDIEMMLKNSQLVRPLYG